MSSGVQKGPQILNGLKYWEQSRAPVVANLISRFIPSSACMAVDVGCGSGSLTKELSYKFDRLIVIDINSETIPRQESGALFFVVADVMRLPVQSGTVDFIFSYGAMHHTRLREALTEIVRVVAPQGTVVIIDFCVTDTAIARRRFNYTRTVLSAFNGYRRRLGIIPAARIVIFRLSPMWRRHQLGDSFLSVEDFRREYGAILNGAKFQLEENRVTVVWRCPNGG